jgi:hypothetical protein
MYEGIKLGSRGHYFTPTGPATEDPAAFDGSCQFAEVVHFNADMTVNLTAWQHDGEQFARQSVDVVGDVDAFEPDLTGRLAAHEGASWHFATACPFGR